MGLMDMKPSLERINKALDMNESEAKWFIQNSIHFPHYADNLSEVDKSFYHMCICIAMRKAGMNNIQNSAKITTPLVEKEDETMKDYEYLFSMNLQAKLKEKIQGAIFVKVDEDDNLIIKITRRDKNNFKMSITDFSYRVLNGLSTDYAAYEIQKKYCDFVIDQFFK